MRDDARDEDTVSFEITLVTSREKHDVMTTSTKRCCKSQAVLICPAREVGELVDDDDSQVCSGGLNANDGSDNTVASPEPRVLTDLPSA